MMLSGGLMLPFFGLISARMQQIPDCSRSLVNTQMICGAVIAVTITFSALLWGLAAFRPDRDPVLTQMLNDLAWLWLLATTGAPAIQPASIGFAILGDKREQPMFPRWAGFMNLWIAVLFVPGVLALFFLTGPFAWNGLFPYWIPFAAFAGWFLMMFFLLRSTMSKAAVR